jgi:hypothetical protein
MYKLNTVSDFPQFETHIKNDNADTVKVIPIHNNTFVRSLNSSELQLLAVAFLSILEENIVKIKPIKKIKTIKT